MKFSLTILAFGMWSVVNTYYNNVKWVAITDDFGNLVKTDTQQALFSLSGSNSH